MAASLDIRIIAVARTPWQRREDAPHQPNPSLPVRATIEVFPQYRDALSDLETYARIWLVFLFHRSRGWAARVKPPRGGPKRGVLATRAPNRPSQIGLTNVALESVDLATGVVIVSGVDLLDETPILDIKPYLPMVDAWPDAGHGWLQPYLEAGVEPKLKKPYRPPVSPSEKGKAK
jgi:tRNA-Thr(GGU) m(6)t(6)A37 methyltransferase TsaA